MLAACTNSSMTKSSMTKRSMTNISMTNSSMTHDVLCDSESSTGGFAAAETSQGVQGDVSPPSGFTNFNWYQLDPANPFYPSLKAYESFTRQAHSTLKSREAHVIESRYSCRSSRRYCSTSRQREAPFVKFSNNEVGSTCTWKQRLPCQTY